MCDISKSFIFLDFEMTGCAELVIALPNFVFHNVSQLEPFFGERN